MKDLMKRVMSFMTFDYPLQADFISARFAETHQKFQLEAPEWSTTATRQQLISTYWFIHVAGHFAFLFGLPALVFFFTFGGFYDLSGFLVALMIAGTLSYSVLCLFHYHPSFCNTYLPRLETVKEVYDQKLHEQQEKCRQAQLSNFSLALLFYVLAKTNKLKPLSCDDHSASLLIKIYGVDQGSMKKNLELILGTAKRKNLSDRKITELKNRFTETYDYLEALEFRAGIERLKELETSFF